VSTITTQDGTEVSDESLSGVIETARVEAFSDGVFAIVITLLVLDLRAPTTRGSMLHELVHQWPVYVAYLASFAYVGVIWVNHHQLFTRIASVDPGLLWRNLALLLPTSVLPFPTAVLGHAFQSGSHADQRVGVIFYSVVAAAMAASWLAVFHYLSRNERLLGRHTPAVFFTQERGRSVFGIAVYVLVALIALWRPAAGLAIAAALPVFYALTTEGWSRGNRLRFSAISRRAGRHISLEGVNR
jgi:TMEM175 potassium channel family protein